MWQLAVGLQAAGMVSKLAGMSSAADAKQKAARRNARFTFAQRMEQIRRDKYQQAQVEGEAVARVGASNVRMQGSPQKYLRELGDEHRRRTAFAEQAAHTEKRLTIESGASPGLDMAMLGEAASSLGGMFNTYNNMTS